MFIIFFFLAMSAFVYYAFQQPVNLVEDDYYKKELEFEDHITKLRNTNALDEKVTVIQHSKSLNLEFPYYFSGREVTGIVYFYRPSNFELDVELVLELDTGGRQIINLSNFISGKYILKLDWAVDSIGYHQEETIIIN